MKKILALALASASCLTLFTGVSQAGWVWETIPFRTSNANVRGYVDSSAFSNGATSAHIDTTIWLSPTADWGKPPSNAPTPDSLWAVVTIRPSSRSGITAGSDSFYVFGEVANTDGWAAHGQLVEPMNLGSGQLGNNATMCAVLLEDANTQDTYRGFLHLGTPLVSVIGSGAVTYAQLFGVPLLRFRVRSDATGEFIMSIGHWLP